LHANLAIKFHKADGLPRFSYLLRHVRLHNIGPPPKNLSI